METHNIEEALAPSKGIWVRVYDTSLDIANPDHIFVFVVIIFIDLVVVEAGRYLQRTQTRTQTKGVDVAAHHHLVVVVLYSSNHVHLGSSQRNGGGNGLPLTAAVGVIRSVGRAIDVGGTDDCLTRGADGCGHRIAHHILATGVVIVDKAIGHIGIARPGIVVATVHIACNQQCVHSTRAIGQIKGTDGTVLGDTTVELNSTRLLHAGGDGVDAVHLDLFQRCSRTRVLIDIRMSHLIGRVVTIGHREGEGDLLFKVAIQVSCSHGENGHIKVIIPPGATHGAVTTRFSTISGEIVVVSAIDVVGLVVGEATGGKRPLLHTGVAVGGAIAVQVCIVVVTAVDKQLVHAIAVHVSHFDFEDAL